MFMSDIIDVGHIGDVKSRIGLLQEIVFSQVLFTKLQQ